MAARSFSFPSLFLSLSCHYSRGCLLPFLIQFFTLAFLLRERLSALKVHGFWSCRWMRWQELTASVGLKKNDDRIPKLGVEFKLRLDELRCFHSWDALTKWTNQTRKENTVWCSFCRWSDRCLRSTFFSFLFCVERRVEHNVWKVFDEQARVEIVYDVSEQFLTQDPLSFTDFVPTHIWLVWPYVFYIAQ